MLSRRRELVGVGKDMWEESAHYSNDILKMTDVSQYLSLIGSHTGIYRNTARRAARLVKMLENPYFGRFDIAEEGFGGSEKIYIGIGSLTDSDTREIYVYDWRAPISGIFYRFEPGKAWYESPEGRIDAEVLLKRQYRIRDRQLKFFFDCSVCIDDEVLQEALGRNASPKMRNIVETIQKEQDIVIRDTENELLIMQGAAGSGKTSVALHRIAFLLYEGIGTRLQSNDILIISPNNIFGRYISGVLPELGEENVRQYTMDELLKECLGEAFQIRTRNMQLEDFVAGGSEDVESFVFKGSESFIAILDRYLRYYEHRRIIFEDVYYDGVMLESRQQLKNRFLGSDASVPLGKRLKRLEDRIMKMVHPAQKERLGKIEKFVQKNTEHDLELKPYSRLISMKDAAAFSRRVRKFTEVDFFEVYKSLFKDRALFDKMSAGLDIPENIGRIFEHTASGLQEKKLRYEDALPLLYVKLRIDGCDAYKDIMQAVIDEAQDYYPMHYKVFSLLFPNARFTLTGDIRQTVERSGTLSLYDRIPDILNRRKTVRMQLNKSYRSSYEISMFARELLGEDTDSVPFDRHEEPVRILTHADRELMDEAVVEEAERCLEQGFESVAVLCRTAEEAGKLHLRMKNRLETKLLDSNEGEIDKGITLMPAYAAKGLEFDAVLVYDASCGNYRTALDRRLLYIACTRALHKLMVFCLGEASPFIK